MICFHRYNYKCNYIHFSGLMPVYKATSSLFPSKLIAKSKLVSCASVGALWPPAGWELASWLSFVISPVNLHYDLKLIPSEAVLA